jgi:hypothetical protein
MSTPLKFTDIVGINITPDKNIQIVGKAEQGYLPFELPGKASAILSALFSAYACELGVGGKEEKESATLILVGYEIRNPVDGGRSLPLLLKCKPDLNLWFTIPVQALHDMGTAFLDAAKQLGEQAKTDAPTDEKS